MAATSGIIGKGTTLGYSATSGGSYTSILELTEVDPPDPSLMKVDFTNSQSTNVENQPGFSDPGESGFGGNFIKTEYAALDALRGTAKYWKITLRDSSTIVWAGWLDKCAPTVDIKGKVGAKITIVNTLGSTFTAG